MKKKIIITFSIIILVVLFLYFRNIYGWYEFLFFEKTPKEFVNYTKIDKENYSRDSVNIVLQMKDYVKDHKESLYSKEYCDSTQFSVDTILYSPNFKKLAVFVIAKNPTHKQLIPDKEYKWYYDGSCYIGNKENKKININWIGPLYTNYYNINSLSNIIREYFFLKYNSDTDINGNKNMYNLDDIRYWDKSIDWKNLEQRRKSEKEFEEEKKKNPKNVYEPK
jgi:hypothetical protein